VNQFEMFRARFLAPLVKARGFGMTSFKLSPKLGPVIFVPPPKPHRGLLPLLVVAQRGLHF
jgi:hypothetical protein